jgi:hypothetical protein
MADNRDVKQPTHRAYSVIRREGQDDFWLNLGLVFPHKDGGGFNIMLQAFPLDARSFAARLLRVTTPPSSPRKEAAESIAAARPGPVVSAMADTSTARKAVEFYTIQLAQLADGAVYVSLTATTVDEEEPQLLNQEILGERVASIDDALAVIKKSLTD